MSLRALTFCLAACLFAVAPARAQTGFDRPGGDYSSFPVRSADPAACAARCEREGRCRAWSFSYPRTAAPGAMCWLKNQVTTRVEDSCCVSGVKGAGVLERKSGPNEFSIDRTGGDFKSMDVQTDATGAVCGQACEAEQRCRAWTYVRPGYLGASARCFLKEKLTRPRHKPCCVSGVVR
ncbi:MAG: apple domain-containing protein [Alphaproteobacteria bacterium]|nr:MAG: apple domain-containing protein [Alphaproteobacteria bacterium]